MIRNAPFGCCFGPLTNDSGFVAFIRPKG